MKRQWEQTTPRRTTDIKRGGRSIYRNRKFRRVREFYLRSHPWCAACEHFGSVVPATVLEHIVPIGTHGGAELNDLNFLGFCDFHANQKSGIESHKGCLVFKIEVMGGYAPRNKSDIFIHLKPKSK